MNNDLIHVNTLPPFKRLCMTIGELPTSYLETMTYYEMLVWFTEYMKNTVIPTINNNSEAVEELQGLYIELKTYIDNYFDNLDVQEEVNIKLDEMAESGELTDIIAQYLGLAGMITFNTVSEMKLAENLVNGSKCYTLGYSSINDGGSAQYQVRTVTNEDVVDDMVIIGLHDNTLVAELVVTTEVNVNALGLSSSNADNSAIINRAISYAKENNIEVVKIGRKDEYNITSPIVIYNKMTFDGNSSTLIKTDDSTYDGYNAIMLFKTYDSVHDYCSDIYLNNVFLSGTDSNKPDYGLYIINGGSYLHLDCVKIIKGKTGIKTNNIWICSFNDIYIDSMDTIGIDFGTNGTTLFINNTFVGYSTNGYKFTGIQYSNLSTIAADAITNVAYEFIGCGLNITSLGCESPNAVKGIKFQNSTVNINESYLYINETNASSCLITTNGSKVEINSTTFHAHNDTADYPGVFIDLGSNSYLSLNGCKYPNHKFLTGNAGSSNCVLSIDGDIQSGCYTGGKSGIRNTILTESFFKGYNSDFISTQKRIKTGNVWFNNYNNPERGYDNFSTSYQYCRKVGDLFINQGNNKTGIAMWQQTTMEEAIYLLNPVTDIVDNTLTIGNGISYNAEAEQCGFTFEVGQKIQNGNGASGTIESISGNNITLTGVVGTFNVGDILKYQRGDAMRDHKYKAVQQLLYGTTAKRPRPDLGFYGEGMMYFDSTLGKPIWWNGSRWVDSTGTNV